MCRALPLANLPHSPERRLTTGSRGQLWLTKGKFRSRFLYNWYCQNLRETHTLSIGTADALKQRKGRCVQYVTWLQSAWTNEWMNLRHLLSRLCGSVWKHACYLHNLVLVLLMFVSVLCNLHKRNYFLRFFFPPLEPGLFSFREGIPSLLGDTPAQTCSCLPGGKPTKNILLKDVCEQLRLQSTWVTSAKYSHKNSRVQDSASADESSVPLTTVKCVSGVKPWLSSMSAVHSQA